MDPQLNKTFVTPCVVKIWTSSHGTDRHHFPGALQSEFNSCTEKSEYMKYPLVDAKPGRLMNDRFFGQIEDDFAMIPDDTSRLNVILMGDNDIRTHGNGGGYRILNKSKKLINLHKDTKHALLLMGQMPSPVSHVQTSGISDYADFRVQREIEKLHQETTTDHQEKIGFVRTSLFFDDPFGFLDHERYFTRDRVHLNHEGAQCLARNLIKNVLSFIQLISD